MKYVCDFALRKGDMKAIKRDKGIEQQYRFNCTVCGLCLAYSPSPWDKNVTLLYLMDGAVMAEKNRDLFTDRIEKRPSFQRPLTEDIHSHSKSSVDGTATNTNTNTHIISESCSKSSSSAATKAEPTTEEDERVTKKSKKQSPPPQTTKLSHSDETQSNTTETNHPL